MVYRRGGSQSRIAEDGKWKGAKAHIKGMGKGIGEEWSGESECVTRTARNGMDWTIHMCGVNEQVLGYHIIRGGLVVKMVAYDQGCTTTKHHV